MSTARRASPAHIADGKKIVVAALIDWAELRRPGWHADGKVFAPDPEDSVFGFAVCASDIRQRR